MIPTQMRVTVTWEDNVDGQAGRPTSCAIAKAINRLYPKLRYVRVTEREIRVTDREKGLRYAWATPLTARQFIKNFDKTKTADGELQFVLRSDEASVQPVTSAQRTEKARAYKQKYQDRVRNETNREATLRKRAARKRIEVERRGKS